MNGLLIACYMALSWYGGAVLTWSDYVAAGPDVQLCVSYDRGSHYGWDNEWTLLGCVPSSETRFVLRPFEGEGLVRVRVVAVRTYRPEGCTTRYCEETVQSEEPHPSICAGVRLQLIPVT